MFLNRYVWSDPFTAPRPQFQSLGLDSAQSVRAVRLLRPISGLAVVVESSRYPPVLFKTWSQKQTPRLLKNSLCRPLQERRWICRGDDDQLSISRGAGASPGPCGQGFGPRCPEPRSGEGTGARRGLDGVVFVCVTYDSSFDEGETAGR